MDSPEKKRRLNEDVQTDNNVRQSWNDSDEDDHYTLLEVDSDHENDLNSETLTVAEESRNAAYDDVEPSTRIIQEARALSNTLNEFTRQELIINLAKTYLDDEVLLPPSRIRDIAREICSSFPGEDMAVYFIEPIGRKAPGGRLYNRFHSQLKKLREKNRFPKSSREINKIQKALEAGENYELDENEKQSVEYLLHSHSNLQEIVHHWTLAFRYRQFVLKDIAKDIQEILAYQWKPLKLSIGHILICEDFKKLHGFDKAASLRLQWKNIFDAEVFELLKEKVKNRPTLRKVAQLPLTDDGYSDIDARLVLVRKYIEKGSSATLYCEHNVDPKILYKVTWLKEGTGKFFQFIKNRKPPYRNFSILGAEIDWKNSNEEQVHLDRLDLDAAGRYYCEVSTDTPIFTKESNVEQMHIIVQQTGPPRITFSKRQFTIGENLVANCTTSKAHPAPHITWLINGKQVDEKYIKVVHLHSGGSGSSGSSGKNSHRSKTSANSQSRDKHESSAIAHIRSFASALSQSPVSSSVDWSREEPLAANGNHLGFEIHQNSAHNTHNSNSNNNIRNIRNRNNGFYSADDDDGDGTSNIETSDYSDDKYFETKKHRNTHRSSHRKYRRHTNDLTLIQLSIEVSELHALNGRLEISCLATIPAHVKLGEQFADYKTYSVKIDIDTVETTTVLPPISDMAALGNSSSRSTFYSLRIASFSINLPIVLFILLHSLRIIKSLISTA